MLMEVGASCPGTKKAAMKGPILKATFNAQHPSDIKNKQNNSLWPSDTPDAQLPDVLLCHEAQIFGA